MLSATIGHYQRELATTWNELTGQQLLEMLQVLQQAYARPARRQDAQLRVLLQLPARAFARLTLVQRVELRPHAQFLESPLDQVPLTAQLLPCLTLTGQVVDEDEDGYYGPREAFRNLRFDEFIFADTFYLRYLKTQQTTWLDQLVAVLYRPERADYRPYAADYAGDRREDFNEHLLASRTRVLHELPSHVKQAVLLWFAGCRRLMEQRYDYVFSGDSTQKDAGGWQEVLHELAGGVHQLDTTARQALPNVLREMNRVLRLHEERQEQSKR